ncbi:phosphate regulon sensor histidine kinase PhoR [Piscinibacter sp. Jin2]|uniref:Phosphate regulon sensor protein PhoR n=1 Tax=Aquariibacter lacus TaxID=2801332 RepID=A0A9X0XIC8_9BURK|nr:phosphate regulon sensor histidine kinase PhoR [Piscinibacter lacus]MBL0720493.1 phosphate regulon sensor histidine kinase PhoR [Piscinibacter lacus]
MGWLLPRLLAGLLALLGGALAGYFLGEFAHLPMVSGLFGACAAVAVLVVLDTLRGLRLMQWLGESGRPSVPAKLGVWGEVAYRVERLLRQSEAQTRQERDRLQRFLSAIEASPNGVLLLDANEQIEWCNGVAAEHFGLDPQRDRLQRITNLVRAPVFVRHLQQGDYDRPVSFHGPDGSVLLTVLVRDYGEGRRLVLTQDITERERAEEMRRHFVANVSHEIRTPLTVLAGFIETLDNLPLTEAERKRVLGLMGQQTRRMQDLVSDLLALAKLEGSPRPPTDRWVEVGPLLDRVLGDARTLSRDRHPIRLEGEAPRGAQIAGNETELHSAVANLVTNAVRYTPEGGAISIAWRRLPEGGGELAVRDAGIGIAREHIPRLTERFYRVDLSRARDTGGTGLGLSIVKHVIQRHGGELEIESQPGRGSTFRLRLPPQRVRGAAGPATPLRLVHSEERPNQDAPDDDPSLRSASGA